MTKTWQRLDNALHKKNLISTPDAIMIDGILSTNKTKMAESFKNNFLTLCKQSEANEHHLPSHNMTTRLILCSNLSKSILQQSYNI